MTPIKKICFNSRNKVRIIWRFVSFIVVMMAISMPLQYGLREWLDRSLLRGNLSVLVAFLSVFISLFVQVRFIDKSTFKKYGMSIHGPWIGEFMVGCGIATIQLSLFFLAMLWSGNLEVTSFFVKSSSDFTIAEGFLSEIYRMLAIGFTEEILFRSFLFIIIFEALRPTGKSTPWRAVATCLIISPFFGIAHATNNGATAFSTINLGFDAMMICLPFIITGRLGMSIGMHFAWNVVQGAIFGFAVSGFTAKASVMQSEMPVNIWTGGDFGPEGSVLLIVMDLLAVLFIVLWKRAKKYDHWVAPDFEKYDG